MSQNSSLKQRLRKIMRLKRSKILVSDQQEKAKQLIPEMINRVEFINSQHIAAYWPVDGEISPIPLLGIAHAMHKKCYLPVLKASNAGRLCFAAYIPGDQLFPNSFGILEPMVRHNECIPAALLDLVFVPLLAFDKQGHRLGTGGGYYDKTFAFLHSDINTQSKSKPYLFGLAYAWQYVEQLPTDSWDISLNGIVTEEYCMMVSG